MIFETNLATSVIILFYSLISIRIYNKGYINKFLINDNYLMVKINQRISSVFILMGIFFVLIDLLAYIFLQQNYMIMINLILKIIFYKISDYYYYYKSKIFERDYLKHLKEKGDKKVFYLSSLLLYILIIIFLIRFDFTVLWVVLIFFTGINIVLFSKYNQYKFWLYWVKFNEAFFLLFVLYLNFEFNILLKYIPVIGIFLLI